MCSSPQVFRPSDPSGADSCEDVESQAFPSQPTDWVATMTEMYTEPMASRHKILVVDDEPSIVDAVATALRYEDYIVEEAGTGREALSAIARFDPDLIV